MVDDESGAIPPWTQKNKRIDQWALWITQAYRLANASTQIPSPSAVALRLMNFGKPHRYMPFAPGRQPSWLAKDEKHDKNQYRRTKKFSLTRKYQI